MSFFEGQSPRWPQHARQQSWDAGQPGARAEASPPPPTSVEHKNAFGAQFEEVQRASENLAKNSRSFGANQHGRRGSFPAQTTFARQYAELDPRYGASQRHYSVGGEFDSIRSHSSQGSSGLQGYLANQRFGGPRGSEAEQMMQAKRRAAAQRERELRNYHQEQQYNRNLSGGKADRPLSPSAMSEEDRRELIARQHRALYGTESNLYTQASDASGVAGPSRSRSNSNSSPAANQGQFAMYDGNQPTTNPTSSSSPAGGESPTRAGTKSVGGSGVAPIGTRPAQAKRNTPPQPSPLGFGFNSDKTTGGNERSQSAASNPATSSAERPSGLGWGSGSGQAPWGSNKMQAPVWG